MISRGLGLMHKSSAHVSIYKTLTRLVIGVGVMLLQLANPRGFAVALSTLKRAEDFYGDQLKHRRQQIMGDQPRQSSLFLVENNEMGQSTNPVLKNSFSTRLFTNKLLARYQWELVFSAAVNSSALVFNSLCMDKVDRIASLKNNVLVFATKAVLFRQTCNVTITYQGHRFNQRMPGNIFETIAWFMLLPLVIIPLRSQVAYPIEKQRWLQAIFATAYENRRLAAEGGQIHGVLSNVMNNLAAAPDNVDLQWCYSMLVQHCMESREELAAAINFSRFNPQALLIQVRIAAGVRLLSEGDTTAIFDDRNACENSTIAMAITYAACFGIMLGTIFSDYAVPPPGVLCLILPGMALMLLHCGYLTGQKTELRDAVGYSNREGEGEEEEEEAKESTTKWRERLFTLAQNKHTKRDLAGGVQVGGGGLPQLYHQPEQQGLFRSPGQEHVEARQAEGQSEALAAPLLVPGESP